MLIILIYPYSWTKRKTNMPKRHKELCFTKVYMDKKKQSVDESKRLCFFFSYANTRLHLKYEHTRDLLNSIHLDLQRAICVGIEHCTSLSYAIFPLGYSTWCNSKLVWLDLLRLSSYFDPHCVAHSFRLVDCLSYA